MVEPWVSSLCPWLLDAFGRLDRAREQGNFGHAWLLTGPRGIGKGNLARALAGRLLGSTGGRPIPLHVNAAAAAMRALREPSDHHPDFHLLAPAPDKNSISVEQVREAVAALGLTSLGGIAKALVVEPAESMTLSAANALLKTLEEPTPSTFFFLVSHQAGFLPATVRSRCQIMMLAAPPAATALDWLAPAVEPADRPALGTLLSLAGGGPLRALALYDGGYLNINNELHDVFNNISTNRLDPQTVADQWLKTGPEVYLSCLAMRLEWAIKARLAPNAWTPVTDAGADALHNAWRGLTLKALFERLQSTRALLGQIGGGVNTDLALRVLLLGFRVGRRET